MKDYGFISPEKAVIEQANDLFTWIQVTNECNLRCVYCYVYKNPIVMSYETYVSIIDRLVDTCIKNKTRVIRLKFAGGEPLIRFELIKQMVAYAKSSFDKINVQAELALITNGTMLNNEMAVFLKQNKFSVGISIDGFAEVHNRNRPFISGVGSHKRTMEGLALLKAHNIPLSAMITITNENAPTLTELIKDLVENNILFNMNLVRETCAVANGSSLDTALIVKELKRMIDMLSEQNYPYIVLGSILDRYKYFKPYHAACGAGSNYLVFNVNGRLVPCQMKINSTGFGLTSHNLLQTNRTVNPLTKHNNVASRVGCSKCLWRHICCGGCPILSQIQYKDGTKPTPFCNINKEVIPALLQLEASRMLRDESKVSVSNIPHTSKVL